MKLNDKEGDVLEWQGEEWWEALLTGKQASRGWDREHGLREWGQRDSGQERESSQSDRETLWNGTRVTVDGQIKTLNRRVKRVEEVSSKMSLGPHT
jgi:hypothetical protein